jgi:hypothetical protein
MKEIDCKSQNLNELTFREDLHSKDVQRVRDSIDSMGCSSSTDNGLGRNGIKWFRHHPFKWTNRQAEVLVMPFRRFLISGEMPLLAALRMTLGLPPKTR